MATGINEQMINKLKVELLDCIESINSLYNRLDTCKSGIQSNYSGTGSDVIIAKLDSIMNQFPKVSSNINTYISDLSKVVKSFADQDVEIASDVIRNISKLDI